jgi:hypothetical protein
LPAGKLNHLAASGQMGIKQRGLVGHGLSGLLKGSSLMV